MGKGRYRRLSLTMTPYKPQVRCSGPLSRPAAEGCNDVAESMPASRGLGIFGMEGAAGVEIGLPLELENRKFLSPPRKETKGPFFSPWKILAFPRGYT